VGIPVSRNGRSVKPLTLPGRAPASTFESLLNGLSVWMDDFAKIFPGGNSGGRMPPAGASEGQPPLGPASVGACQGLDGRYRDALVVHGKEKVYGSIP